MHAFAQCAHRKHLRRVRENTFGYIRDIVVHTTADMPRVRLLALARVCVCAPPKRNRYNAVACAASECFVMHFDASTVLCSRVYGWCLCSTLAYYLCLPLNIHEFTRTENEASGSPLKMWSLVNNEIDINAPAADIVLNIRAVTPHRHPS